MPARLTRPPKRFQQPQGPVPIDRNNPLGAKVITHLPLGSHFRRGTRSSSEAVTLGSGGVYAVGSKGISLKGDAVNPCASVPLNLSAYSQITVAVWLFWPNVLSGADKLAFEFTPNTNTNAGGFYCDPDTSGAANNFELGCINNAGVSSVSVARFTPRPSVGVWHRILWTWDITLADACAAIYVDGISQTVTHPFSQNTGATTFANDTLHLNSRNEASLFGDYQIQDLTFYRGLLTAAEAKADFENPYQIFETRSVPPFVAAATDMPPSCVYCGDEGESVFEAEDTAPFDFANDAPQDVLPPISAELPQSFEWEDPNETEAALWPDYWAQAPPIANAAAETGGQSNEDSSAQLPDEDEDFGFAQDGIAPPDQIFVEDASTQPEDQDEDFGFLASPLDVPVAADLIPTEDSDGQLEEVEDDASFYDQPLPADVVSDQVFTEDADAQTEELEEDFGFTDAPLPDEHDLGVQHIEQPGDDEEVEGFADAPAETVDPSLIAPECADNQVDVEDELFGFSHVPPPDPLPCAAAVFPPANQVLSGVVYGPNGNDYTGTLNPGSGSGGVYLRRR